MKQVRDIGIHLILFLLTITTTTLAGAEWIYGSAFNADYAPNWRNLEAGFTFATAFIGVLTVHEVGHYFTARYYKLKVSLPYYLPMWLGFLGMPTLGTLGAYIRIKDPISTQRQMFDIGVAGPLAGLVAAIALLLYGYSHLPSLEYLYSIHPEYRQYGANYLEYFKTVPNNVGIFATQENIMMWLIRTITQADAGLVPHPYEMMHYPLLFAGYWSLVFTSMNLLPIGQLDGGHVLYGLLGAKKHFTWARIFFILFLLYGGMNAPTVMIQGAESFNSDLFNNLFYLVVLYVALLRPMGGVLNAITAALSLFTLQYGQQVLGLQLPGYSGWLAFGLLLGRFLGVHHPPAVYEEGLNPMRKAIGILALVLFIMCFVPKPLEQYSAAEVRYELNK